MNDPILSEIRQIRDAFSEHHHGDISAMLADLHDSQTRSGRKTVSLPPRVCSSTAPPSLSQPAARQPYEPDLLFDEIVESAAPKQAS